MDQFISTPNGSDVDLLIENFRIEVCRNTDDLDSTRKLTVNSPIQPTSSASNFDKQITDLENLIKKLQDEITEMSKNSDKKVDEYMPIISEDSYEVREDLSNETIIIDNECDNSKETDNTRDKMKQKNSKDCFKYEQDSHVFPIIIRDVILPIDYGSKTLTQEETLFTVSPNKKVPEKTLSIGQEIMEVWDDMPLYTLNDNLEVRIDELQAEISKKMVVLKDFNAEESDEKFEDAQ